MSAELIVLGAGGFAREVLAYLVGAGARKVVFVDETAAGGAVLSSGGYTFDVVNDWRAFENREAIRKYREFVVAVGSPPLKRKLVAAALAHGLAPAPTLIHEHAQVYGSDVAVGRGGVIAPGCRLTTNIRIGDYVALGINTLVGHDSVLGDYVTCNPGSQVSGSVTLGDGVLVGSGGTIREAITIASDVTIGAQACVVKNIREPGITVVGVPARKMNTVTDGDPGAAAN